MAIPLPPAPSPVFTDFRIELTKLRVKVTLQLTVGQSVSPSWCRAHLGLMITYLILFDSSDLFFFLWGAL
jgi:hypothetical protein